MIPSPAAHRESHSAAAVCLWCSDQVSWWRDVRRRQGVEEPPYLKKSDEGFSTKEVGGPTVPPRQTKRCWCGRLPMLGSPTCQWHVLRVELQDAHDDNRALAMDEKRG